MYPKELLWDTPLSRYAGTTSGAQMRNSLLISNHRQSRAHASSTRHSIVITIRFSVRAPVLLNFSCQKTGTGFSNIGKKIKELSKAKTILNILDTIVCLGWGGGQTQNLVDFV